MPGSEELSPKSYEEIAFRDELEIIIKDHYQSGDIAIIQDDDLTEHAEIMFAGRLRARPPHSYVDVNISIFLYEDGEEVTNIGIGETEYMVAKEEIICGENPEYSSGDRELMKLRFWMRETKWSKTYTELLAQKLEGQP